MPTGHTMAHMAVKAKFHAFLNSVIHGDVWSASHPRHCTPSTCWNGGWTFTKILTMPHKPEMTVAIEVEHTCSPNRYVNVLPVTGMPKMCV